MDINHYESISKIFDYPDENYHDNVIKAINSISNKYPDAVKELKNFLELLPAKTSDLQEIFMKSFEVQAITSLDVGYVLFGDDYRRGAVLAKLSEEHTKTDNNCGQELVDCLPNLLRLLPKIKENDTAKELVTMLIVPAVEKMMNEYDIASIEAKEKFYKKQYKTLIVSSFSLLIFLHAFKALYILFDSDFSLIKENHLFKEKSFFGNIKRELDVEEGKQSSNSCHTLSCGVGSC